MYAKNRFEGIVIKGKGSTLSKKTDLPVENDLSEEIIDTDVSDELRNSFLEYSMSVIVARALPDVRDGLKPVQRRILYSMHDNNMVHNKGYSKCARVVGDVMGKYHPHGDMAIYEALVRMAQNFSLREPVIDGHGNFGSLDDGPAASRYTECRLAPIAEVMVSELDEKTVDFKLNYDGREQEPKVLPAGFPNLLVNGITGIAVGMATNIAPHNLGEVVEGVKAMLLNPKITLDELMKFIPGPDMPTGGIIIGLDGVKESYQTGRGQFRIKARAEITDVSSKKKGIIVTELPYMVGPEKVIGRIKELINDKKLLGISNVADYSDRKTGLRLVIECKTGFNPHAILDELYRLTPLEESFSVNAVALVDSSPQTLGLRELCHYFIKHRLEVTKRRTQYRRDKAAARAHILEGILTALGDIDKVIALVKASKDSASARVKLMKEFNLSEIQAEAILEMTIRRLTSLEVGKIKDELAELKKIISKLDKILNSDKVLRELVSSELDEVSRKFATPRKSKLVKGEVVSSQEAASMEIPDTPCMVYVTPDKYLVKNELIRSGKITKTDYVISKVSTSTRNNFGVITSKGRLVKISVLEIPTKPIKVEDYADLAKDEKFIGLVDFRDEIAISLGTKNGVVKRVDTSGLSKKNNTYQIINLAQNDEVVGCGFSNVNSESSVVFVTKEGNILRTESKNIRPQGPGGGGMAGIKLKEADEVIAFYEEEETALATLITVTDLGNVKVSKLEEYPTKGRATGGMKCHLFKKRESALIEAYVGVESKLLTAGWSEAEMPAHSFRRDGSGIEIEYKYIARLR